MLSQSTFALITGASSGLGQEAARQLAQAGRIKHAVLVGRNRQALEETQSDLRRFQVSSTIVVCDLADFKTALPQIQQATDPLFTAGWTLNWLVLAAGFGTPGKLEHCQTISSQIAVNCTAVTGLCQQYLPKLPPQNGHALLFASVAAFIPQPYLATYAATKSFVLSLSLALRQEYPDLRITAVCPNPVQTHFFDHFETSKKSIQRIGIEQTHTVVKKAIRNCDHNRALSLSCFKTRFIYCASRLCPQVLIQWVMRQIGIYRR